MEFIYPAGAHNWKIKITPKWNSRKSMAPAPCDMKIVDTHDMKTIFQCDYQSEEKCLEVWDRLSAAWESGKCYWDDQLHRLVWKSELSKQMLELPCSIRI